LQGILSYAYAYARAKAIESDLIKSEKLNSLVSTRDLNQFINSLNDTHYREYFSYFSTKYSGINLVEVAINSYLVKISKISLNICPRVGLDALRAYISKWDVQNIKTVISSKVLGRSVKETESFLISEHDLPAGLIAGPLSHEEFRLMLEMPDVESIINFLLKFPYGKVLYEKLDSYRKTGDPGEMLIALDLFYYKTLQEKIRIVNGNEMPILHLISSQIDTKNIMTIIRSIESGLNPNDIRNLLIEGGSLKGNRLEDLLHSNSVEEVVEKIKNVYDLTSALNKYRSEKDIKEFEIELERYIVERNISSFRLSSPGLSSIIGLLLMFETERENLRKIAYGIYYGLSEERIKSMLIRVV